MNGTGGNPDWTAEGDARWRWDQVFLKTGQWPEDAPEYEAPA